MDKHLNREFKSTPLSLELNHNAPRIMHVDLNSCFATCEQQANPLLRGKPLVVAAYTSPNGCVLAPSIEAKRFGIKTGMTVRDARLLCKDVIVRPSNPDMYEYVHLKFRNIFNDYSPDVTPKSIDEAVIDFTSTYALHRRTLEDIGMEIKKRFRKEIGEWMSCNIGISTNRFLAKLAASLHKPDGLDKIDHHNVLDVYKSVGLLDLNGINIRYQARLNAYGIFTPMDFYNASLDTLKKQVFQSINGYYWYLRLRGWEIDAVDFGTKSIGNQYALKHQTNNPRELSQLLMKLCEKTGRRLRRSKHSAQGVYVSTAFTDMSHFGTGRMWDIPFYTTKDIFVKAQRILNMSGYPKPVRSLAVSVYGLIDSQNDQLELFSEPYHKVSEAMDKINDKYGEFVITPALMMGMENVIIKRIAFGGVKELEEIYS